MAKSTHGHIIDGVYDPKTGELLYVNSVRVVMQKKGKKNAYKPGKKGYDFIDPNRGLKDAGGAVAKGAGKLAGGFVRAVLGK
jgi:hypothetical protein